MSGLEEMIIFPDCKCDNNYYWSIKRRDGSIIGYLNSLEWLAMAQREINEFEYGVVNLRRHYKGWSYTDIAIRTNHFVCAGCSMHAYYPSDRYYNLIDIMKNNWGERTFKG